MKVEKGLLVQCEYDLSVAGGDVLESSKKTGPIEFVQGAGKMLAALEEKLAGMEVGEERKGKLPASAIPSAPPVAIPKSLFPKDAKLEVGAKFEAKDPKGRPLQLEVSKIEDDQVTARAIHPLEGKELEFRVKVLAVRKPPPPVPTKPPPPRKEVELEADDLVEAPPSSISGGTETKSDD